MKNILLIGAGRFGRHIAMQLSQLEHQIMAVDIDEERINDVLHLVTNAQIGDSTNPEKQVAEWAAIRYTADHIFDYMEIDEQHAIFEVEVPHEWIGKSVGELNIRRKYGINILGIKHSGKTDVSITPDTVLSGEITILALGEYKALQKCFRI